MPRTALTVQTTSRAGLAAVYSPADAVNGNDFPNTGGEFLHVKNTGAAPVTLTIPTPVTIDGLAVADRTVSIPATTGDLFIGPFDNSFYGGNDGRVQLDWSAATGVTIAVLKRGS